MPKPILLVYSAEECPACVTFMSNKFDTVKATTVNYVQDVIHLSQKSTSSSANPALPRALIPKVAYFPSIFLIRAADWSAAQKDKDANVESVLFNARSGGDLVTWIKETSTQASLTDSSPSGGSIRKRSTPVPQQTHQTTRLQPSIANSNGQGYVCSSAYRLRGKR